MGVRTPLSLTLEQESHQWCRRVGGTIIRLRHERRWSQRRLGIEVGLSQRQVAQLEANPDAQMIGRLVGTLHALGWQLLVQPIDPDEPRK